MAGERDIEFDPETVDRVIVLQPDEVEARSRAAREAFANLLTNRSGYELSEDQRVSWWRYA